jgi:hypothetical protein
MNLVTAVGEISDPFLCVDPTSGSQEDNLHKRPFLRNST